MEVISNPPALARGIYHLSSASRDYENAGANRGHWWDVGVAGDSAAVPTSLPMLGSRIIVLDEAADRLH